jgi:hypothetical protein
MAYFGLRPWLLRLPLNAVGQSSKTASGVVVMPDADSGKSGP